MEMPKPGAEHKRLEALAGKWVGDEKIHPSAWDPKGGPATASVTSKMAMDGFFLVVDYEETRGGRVSYRGHGVYGWWPEKKCYTMHWFDSMGGGGYGAPATGTWEGDTLTFQSQNPMGHGRYTYRILGKDRYGFRIDGSQDGKSWKPMMEGTYSRKK